MTAAIILLIITSPVFLIASIALLISNKGEVFFYQDRPGLNECTFKIVKFKTMADKFDNSGNLLPDAKRITIVGNILRKFSLDELPQLVNVVKSDMSLIGPRPLLVRYLPLYNKEQKRRHLIRPGITGWAQVNGRNNIGWNKKFELDIFYVDNVSLGLDIKIIWMTILKIIKRTGTNLPSGPFRGNEL